MSFWKMAGLLTGLAVAVFITRKCKCSTLKENEMDSRYDVDDLMTTREI